MHPERVTDPFNWTAEEIVLHRSKMVPFRSISPVNSWRGLIAKVISKLSSSLVSNIIVRSCSMLRYKLHTIMPVRCNVCHFTKWSSEKDFCESVLLFLWMLFSVRKSFAIESCRDDFYRLIQMLSSPRFFQQKSLWDFGLSNMMVFDIYPFVKHCAAWNEASHSYSILFKVPPATAICSTCSWFLVSCTEFIHSWNGYTRCVHENHQCTTQQRWFGNYLQPWEVPQPRLPATETIL